jgi:cellulose synthase/poly-beta-1,6-N-acetylglucosamine synthase-like glycosyltransferase
MEWIILDDGEDCVKDVFDAVAKTIPNVKYIRQETKLLIGAKRNILNKASRGEIVVAMDDDDFYFPERVSNVVVQFARNKVMNLQDAPIFTCITATIRRSIALGPMVRTTPQMGRWLGDAPML